VVISDGADKFGSRHGSLSDATDSSAAPTGSWWGCYLHNSVPSVAAVYATLQQQSARSRCRSPTSSPSTLHVSWARTGPRFQEPARSWWGCYLHSSVPSVAVVYATLRRQSARFCCRSPASSPSTLHVSWARTSPCTEPRCQEPTRS